MTKDDLEEITELFGDKVDKEGFNLFDLFDALPNGTKTVEVRQWAIKRGLDEKVFDRGARKWRIKSDLGTYPSHPRDFVDAYTKRQGLSVRFDGMITGMGTMTRYGIIDLQRDLRLYADRADFRMKVATINDAALQWRSEQREQRLKAFVRDIAFDPDATPDWHSLVASIVDLNRHSAAYAIAVLKGYIWQVKRRVVGVLVAHDPFMPVIQGAQGVGKGTLFETLHRGLEEFVARPSLSELTDPRQADLFETPCLFTEELAGAGKADVAAFKTMVSRPAATYRPMATNGSDKLRQLASLWGDCNGSLGSHFRDPTGMRRFAPLNAGAKDTPANRAAGMYVTNIPALLAFPDTIALWRSVDETATHPLLSDPAVFDEWQAWQEEERVQDSAEQWLRDVSPVGSRLSAKGRIEREDIYAEYAEWCVTHKTAAFAAQAFWRMISVHEQQDWFPFTPVRKSNGKMVRDWKPERVDEHAELLNMPLHDRIVRESKLATIAREMLQS